MSVVRIIIAFFSAVSAAFVGGYRTQHKGYRDIYEKTMRPRSYKDDKVNLMRDKSNIARDMHRVYEQIKVEHNL